MKKARLSLRPKYDMTVTDSKDLIILNTACTKRGDS